MFIRFLYYLFLKFIFNQRIIALQCFVGFCHTMWISCMYIQPFPLEPPFKPPSTPLAPHRAWSWAPWLIRQLPASYLLHTWECIYLNATLELRILVPFSAPYKIQSSELQTPSPQCRWQITWKWGKRDIESLWWNFCPFQFHFLQQEQYTRSCVETHLPVGNR